MGIWSGPVTSVLTVSVMAQRRLDRGVPPTMEVPGIDGVVLNVPSLVASVTVDGDGVMETAIDDDEGQGLRAQHDDSPRPPPATGSEG